MPEGGLVKTSNDMDYGPGYNGAKWVKACNLKWQTYFTVIWLY